MDIVRELFMASARHRRRGLKEQTLRKGDMLLAAWMIAAIFIRITTNAALAHRELSPGGNAAAGAAVAELTILNVFAVAFIVTFLFGTLSFGAMSLNRTRLGAAPVSFMTLFVSEIAARLANPLNWIVVPFIVPAGLPLLLYPRPLPGLVALLFCFTAVCLVAWALAAALSIRPRISQASGAMKLACAASLIVLVLANFDVRWNIGSTEILVFQKPFLLTDYGAAGLLPLTRPWSPSAWVTGAASLGTAPWLLPGAAGLLFSIAISGVVSHLSRRALAKREEDRRPGLRIRRKMGRRDVFGMLVSNETATHLESTGARAGLLWGVGCSLWLLLTPEPTVSIAVLGSIFAVASGFSYASNALGNDGFALRRYVLASLDWGTLFLAKNLAFGVAAGAPLLLLCLAVLLRVSPAAALSLALTSAAMLVACAVWGNLSSMLIPALKRGEAGRRTAFVNEAFPMAIWLAALAVHRSAGGFGGPGYAAGMAGVLALACAVYAPLIAGFSRHFSEEVERILEKL